MSSIPYRPRFISKAPRGRKWIPKAVREEVYRRDGYTCQYCHKSFDVRELTIEHVVPVSEGGLDDIVNYITACRSCNSSKRDKSVIEFLERKHGVTLWDLPIHGDIIMDTPELDDDYRLVRHLMYCQMRAKGQLAGKDAFKKLERCFRRNLWNTLYGQILAKRYPELPGQVRASIPLVEYLVPDSRKPVHRLLVEFCKAAHTRALIDDMIRVVSNSPYEVGDVDRVIRSVICSGWDSPTEKRIDQAFKRAGLRRDDWSIFQVPAELLNVPLNPRDLVVIKIQRIDNGVGFADYEGYEIRVPQVSREREVEVVIMKVTANHAEAEVAKVPEPLN